MLVGSGWQERYTFISLHSNGRRNSHHSVQNIKADTGYSSSSSCEGDCRHSRSLSSEAFLDSSSSCNRSLQTPLLQPQRECELLGSCGGGSSDAAPKGGSSQSYSYKGNTWALESIVSLFFGFVSVFALPTLEWWQLPVLRRLWVTSWSVFLPPALPTLVSSP